MNEMNGEFKARNAECFHVYNLAVYCTLYIVSTVVKLPDDNRKRD